MAKPKTAQDIMMTELKEIHSAKRQVGRVHKAEEINPRLMAPETEKDA